MFRRATLARAAFARAAFARATFAAVCVVAPALGGAQALPAAASLMERHNAAAGGRAALDRHSSMKMTATVSVPMQRIEAKMEIYRAKPNKIFTKTVIAQMGEILEGFDGTVGWAINPMAGAQLATGANLDLVRDNADFFATFQDSTRYTKAETVEVVEFEGKRCYKVRLTRAGRDAMVYFDSTAGLIAGLAASMPTPQGNIDGMTVFMEYVDVDGVKFPKRVESRTMQGSTVIVFDSIEFDKVDSTVFTLPAAVKALVKP